MLKFSQTSDVNLLKSIYYKYIRDIVMIIDGLNNQVLNYEGINNKTITKN